LGTRGTAEPLQKNLRERQGYARISLEINFDFYFEPIQKSGSAGQKYKKYIEVAQMYWIRR